ncbi:MAG: GNAT family N-acetyltransferase [Thermoplasmata archaeon]|jgi:GNAT superfamily N-acetyltransferase|nr:GNAT family N-acetyltransferase [Thermoplasmata archaeon]
MGTPPTNGTDVLVVKNPQGALSLEFVPVREKVARAFLRNSPRGLSLSKEDCSGLGEELLSRGYSAIKVQDNRKKLLARSLAPVGWGVSRAVGDDLGRDCTICTPSDLPLDPELCDENGCKLELRGTDSMVGIGIDLGGRKAWAFYTDDGETARIVSGQDRRQGMLVAYDQADLTEAVACLLRFLVASRKNWAVFSEDLGRFVRPFDPGTMWRMVLDRPTSYDHTAKPLSKENRKQATALFSEYYDEPTLTAMLRLRRFASDPSYSIHLVDGGFVIVRLDGETGLVYDIYVTPSKQGTGLGGELMRCALSHLAGRANSVILHTSFPRAKAMYEKFGFKATYSQLTVRLDETVLTPPSS